ncbi:MAG: Ig-like domain-containing domain [Planctomycetota bacterium]|jgi:hypothetical protein
MPNASISLPGRLRLATLLVALVTACSAGDSAWSIDTPFQLVTASPDFGSSNVALTAPVHLVFSRPVDATTVDEDSIVVTTADGERVRGSVQMRALTPTTVTFRPRGQYELGVEHRISISSAVRDVAGESLPHDYLGSFSTRKNGSSSSGPIGGGGSNIPGRGCDPVGITVWYTGPGDAFHTLDPDTLETQQVFEGGHPSHLQYKCMFWFLTTALRTTLVGRERSVAVALQPLRVEQILRAVGRALVAEKVVPRQDRD